MGVLGEQYAQMIAAMNVAELSIPTTGIKLYSKDQRIPDEVRANQPEPLTLTSCQALKQSGLGDAVCLTRNNIGCVAAAISLGLVDQHEDQPLGGHRVYTDLMAHQAGKGHHFTPPTPQDFTQGTVYACKAANRPDFGLFGPEDSGRFKDVDTARKAVAEMQAIQPANIAAVFFFSPEYEEIDLEPDVVVQSVRPVELTRIIQAYQFMTGKRVQASMGGLRVVNSDLIARPYLSGEINISTFCLGARLIAEFQADRLGIGIPWPHFKTIVQGLKSSQTGYPFEQYPGARV